MVTISPRASVAHEAGVDFPARLRVAAITAGLDCVITPALPGADPIDRLRAELAGMRIRGVPLYRLGQITRERVASALDLLDGVEAYREIRGTPTEVVALARDLYCMQAAELDCMEEPA